MESIQSDINIKTELPLEQGTRYKEDEEDSDCDDDEDKDITEQEAQTLKQVCRNCELSVESKSDLIDHIIHSDECFNLYGAKGLEKLKKDELPKVIEVQYQTDENIACAPVIEDGCSKLDHSNPKLIRTLSTETSLLSKCMPPGYSESVEAFVGT